MFGWRIVIIVWMAVAALALAFGPRAAPTTALTGADELPQLPEPKPRDAEAMTDALRAAQLWGAPRPLGVLPGAAVAGEAPLTPPDWRIVAVVSGSHDRFVSVRQGEQPPVELRVGQSLPDGSQIRRIEPTALYLIVRGKKRVLRIDER
jgi:hypothetical protein